MKGAYSGRVGEGERGRRMLRSWIFSSRIFKVAIVYESLIQASSGVHHS
jgi:hypothetical protein